MPSSGSMKRSFLFPAIALLIACAPTSKDPEGTPASRTCDASSYSEIIGLDLAEVTLPADLEQRVIRPGSAITMDFRANRMNIDVSHSGRILRIWCG